jgi:hypothetical protein
VNLRRCKMLAVCLWPSVADTPSGPRRASPTDCIDSIINPREKSKWPSWGSR